MASKIAKIPQMNVANFEHSISFNDGHLLLTPWVMGRSQIKFIWKEIRKNKRQIKLILITKMELSQQIRLHINLSLKKEGIVFENEE